MRVLHLGKFCPPKEGGIEIFSFDLLKAKYLFYINNFVKNFIVLILLLDGGN